MAEAVRCSGELKRGLLGGYENVRVRGARFCADCGDFEFCVDRNFYGLQAGGVIAGLVAQGDGNSGRAERRIRMRC